MPKSKGWIIVTHHWYDGTTSKHWFFDHNSGYRGGVVMFILVVSLYLIWIYFH